MNNYKLQLTKYKVILRHSQPIISGGAMEKYVCTLCGYEYDPEVGDPDSGIEPGTPFEDIPEDWICPVCGARKEDFALEE
ncbi:hypothetical protein NUACC21_58540 [Scytonema sp. NUACC21]